MIGKRLIVFSVIILLLGVRIDRASAYPIDGYEESGIRRLPGALNRGENWVFCANWDFGKDTAQKFW